MKEFDDLYEVIKYLRSEKGCPWDREQTSESISFDLIEEVYEINDAIESKNIDKLKEELGDLLFLILMHIRIKEEEGRFTLEEILSNVKEKMIYRHPHVFGKRNFNNLKELLENWEKSKEYPFESIPDYLPALLMGQKIVEKIKRLNPELDKEKVYSMIISNIQNFDEYDEKIIHLIIDASYSGKNLEKDLRQNFVLLKRKLSEKKS